MCRTFVQIVFYTWNSDPQLGKLSRGYSVWVDTAKCSVTANERGYRSISSSTVYSLHPAEAYQNKGAVSLSRVCGHVHRKEKSIYIHIYIYPVLRLGMPSLCYKEPSFCC